MDFERVLKEELTRLNHDSSNTHYYGYSSEYDQNIFAKIFTSRKRFCNELNALKSIRSNDVLDYFEYKDCFVIVLKFHDYTDVSVENIDYYNLGIMIAQYHNAFEKIARCNGDNKNLIEKIEDSISFLKEHKKYCEVAKFYERIKRFLPQVLMEYDSLHKMIIHGDFGLRNVKRIGTELVLIDFERIRYDIGWNEFGKFFKRECNERQRTEFLKGYRRIRELQEPSPLLKVVLDFNTALGIYKYTLKIEDDAFESLADKTLEEIDCRLKSLN